MGLPDTSSLASYGGALTNYGTGVVDPTTDRDASAANQAYADTAAMTHTSTRAWCRFTAAASSVAMALVAHDAHWGNAALVAPVLARSAAGVFTITWPVTVTDELAATHTLNLRAGHGNARGGATHYSVDVVPTAPNVLTVRVFDAAGAANDAVGVDIDTFAI